MTTPCPRRPCPSGGPPPHGAPGPAPPTRLDTGDPTLPATIRAQQPPDHWPACECGNDPTGAGFYAVADTGRWVEPIEADWPRPLMGCNNPACGLVHDLDGFDPATLTYPVVGRIVTGRLAAATAAADDLDHPRPHQERTP
ncbi:hypothetical protein [Saccharothrix sp. HUAS TT1]|uniref:hypothetical protein n=1 Tax=unclassified Saccharothrix TaxID=2593673 RepID=UPI00345C5179